MSRPASALRRPSARLAALALLAAAAAPLVASGTADAARAEARPRQTRERPRLVLAITVDQLRGDTIPRFRTRFGEGGFRRLLERGTWYADARYRHSTTYTAVGHATLFTGAGPIDHGLVANDWADRATGERVYCVEDPAHRLLGDAPTPPHAGTGPRNLLCSTIGDELVDGTAGRARAFSVSIKDRGAILPGGFRGKAFWYASAIGGFSSSTYYYDALPEWAAAWNATRPAERFRDTAWELSRPATDYERLDSDDRPEERPVGGLGRTFPHPLGGPRLYSDLRSTPMGDALTCDFALELLHQERLGQGAETDLLAISFSCTDYVGHAFGPYSLEAEDNVLRLDATLARLFDGVDEAVGLERTLIVLSADHGVDAIPEWRHAQTCTPTPGDGRWVPRREGSPLLVDADSGRLCCAAGRHVPEELLVEAEARLRARWGAEPGPTWVRAFHNPSVYLDAAAVAAAGLELDVVAQELARELRDHPGFAFALTRADLARRGLADVGVLGMLERSFHPERSGDVLVVPSSFWFLGGGALAVAATHGSPYVYDTHVPLLLAGPGVPRAEVHRRVSPADLAPTLAALLGVQAPSAADGEVLREALGR